MLNNEILDNKSQIIDYISGLGIDVSRVSNESMLLTAFIHKSYSADFDNKIFHNERLEFLGDAILGGIIAKALFNDFGDLSEATLTLYKIALIRTENLSSVAKDIGLDKMIFLGKGEEKSGGRSKDTILEDCMEALIGYIYLDLGIEEVEKFILKYVYTKLDQLKSVNVKSYKTMFQEHIQKIYKIVPEYVDVDYEIDGKGNTINYKSEVFVLNKKYGEGFGSNKKTAQENAAEEAYNNLSF